MWDGSTQWLSVQEPSHFSPRDTPLMRKFHSVTEAQAGIKIAQRNINNLRYAYNTTLMAESEEELKSFLMKEESEKAGLTQRSENLRS